MHIAFLQNNAEAQTIIISYIREAVDPSDFVVCHNVMAYGLGTKLCAMNHLSINKAEKPSVYKREQFMANK